MCDLSLALGAVSTGLGLVQQQQQVNAANKIQRQQADLQRRQLVNSYGSTQRRVLQERDRASQSKAEAALQALAARERARTVAGAQGKDGGSRSVKQAINAITAQEGREAQKASEAVANLVDDARAQDEAAYLSSGLRALSNTTASGPNYLGESLGFLKSARTGKGSTVADQILEISGLSDTSSASANLIGANARARS